MSSSQKPSRQQHREFLKLRGIFGVRKTPEELQAEAEKKAAAAAQGKSHTPYIRRYLGTLKKHRLRLCLILFFLLLQGVLQAAMPWSGKVMIDYVLTQDSVRVLFGFCGALLLIYLCQCSAGFAFDMLTNTFVGVFVTTTKHKLMRHLQKLPLERLQELKVGGITTRVQSDTEAMAGLLQLGVLTPARALVQFVLSAGSLVVLNWKVAAACLSFSLTLATISYLFFTKLRPLQMILREELAAIGARLTEVFGGIQVVRAFGRERQESHRFTVSVNTMFRKYFHSMQLERGLSRLDFFLFLCMQVVVWAYGGYLVMHGQMTVGDLTACIMLVNWILGPIDMIMNSFSQIQSNLASAERVFDLLDEPEAMPDSPTARCVETLKQDLRFEQVVFDYPNGTRALHGIDLLIPKGSTTALVGPSGAGKSTIANLVMRFYDVTEGRVLVDGCDVRDVQLTPYRRMCSLVLQDVFLFDGTVRENIAFGRPGATLEEVEAAAKRAHCDGFVAKLDHGYETMIGERGVRLSMGQKQRISLARAILVDPQILILDEATSSLDSESEALIQDALHDIFQNRTVIVIAHRLSTIVDADKIVVVEDGRIVEEGPHAELLARTGRYHELYTKQMEKAERRKSILDWNDDFSSAGETSS